MNSVDIEPYLIERLEGGVAFLCISGVYTYARSTPVFYGPLSISKEFERKLFRLPWFDEASRDKALRTIRSPMNIRRVAEYQRLALADHVQRTPIIDWSEVLI